MKSIHIYDLDGTIIDSSHRYRTIFNGVKLTIDLAYWIANVKRTHEDKLLPLAEQYIAQRQDPDVHTIFCTCRQANQIEIAMPWIVENLGLPDKFFFTETGYTGSGAVWKADTLENYLSHDKFQNVKRYFYEDNISYLDAVCARINAQPIFVESPQGY